MVRENCRTRLSVNRPEKTTMNRKSILAFGLFTALLLTTTAAAPLIHFPQSVRPAAKPAVHSSSITIPFELANRHIMLKIRVNESRPLAFVLDTGDKYAIIDLDRARELGLKLEGEVRMHGAGSEAPIGAFARDASFSVPGLDGFSQPVTLALPIRRMAPKLGQDFDGIIGHDFIKQFVVEVDYQAQQLKLHDKDKFSYSGPGQSIPIKINSAGHPIIEAEVTPVGGVPIKGKFVVDIGSGMALALHSPIVSERNLLGPHAKTIKALGAGGAGGRVTGQIGRVAELKISTYSIKEPITLFAEDKAGAFANSVLVGNIGAQVMNKFRVFLDYHHDRIILEPNSTFARPFDRAFTGLSIEAQGADYRTFRITDVLEHSPASENRLQKDDVITAINGRPAVELTLTKLNELFERPVAYELTVKRGEQTVKVKLTPRRLV